MWRAVLTGAHWDPEHAPFERLNPGRSLGLPKAKAADRLSLLLLGEEEEEEEISRTSSLEAPTPRPPQAKLPLEALGPQPHQMELGAEGLDYRACCCTDRLTSPDLFCHL